MTNDEREAKIEALNEAADHLENTAWTTNTEEYQQGIILATTLKSHALKLRTPLETTPI